MQVTSINWTDLSWNPASGCDEVSPECAYCYAKLIAETKRGTAAFPNGFDVTMRPWKLDEPRRVKKPSLIFTNSMTDMFHEKITDEYRDAVIAKMNAYNWHRYQVLTKRPENALRYFSTRPVPDCMWLGVTVGVRKTTIRLDILRHIKAKVRFVSAEPLLEDLDGIDLNGIHWLIAGGESGNHLMDPKICARRALVRRGDRKKGEALWMPREDRIAWLRHLRDTCEKFGTAFWFKQFGGSKPESGGRELDGQLYNGMPVHIEGAMPPAYASEAPNRQFSLPVIQ